MTRPNPRSEKYVQLAWSPGAVSELIVRNEACEAELQKLRQALVHLAKLSALGTTAAMIVHEVAQPVTAATNYLAAVQRLLANERPETSKNATKAVSLAQDSLLRAAEIMNRVKLLARSRAFCAEPLNLHDVIAEVLKLYTGTWVVVPRVSLGSSACHVLGDRIQLAQVFSNLIRNAIEATEGQSERHVTVRSRRTDNGMVEIRVEDNGPGVPAQITPNLFSAFSSSKPDGLGVGLSICRTIVEQHQGEIWAEALADGTSFCFTLPVPPDESEKCGLRTS